MWRRFWLFPPKKRVLEKKTAFNKQPGWPLVFTKGTTEFPFGDTLSLSACWSAEIKDLRPCSTSCRTFANPWRWIRRLNRRKLFSEFFFWLLKWKKQRCSIWRFRFLNMYSQIFGALTCCFRMLVSELMGGSVDMVGSVDTTSIGLKHGFHVFQDWEAWSLTKYTADGSEVWLTTVWMY